MQSFCKHQNEEKRPCRSPANAKMRKSALAEVLQTPKWEKALLQESCKRQNGEKRFCRNAAKPRNFFEVFAGVPQVSQKTFWRLRESRKSLGKLFGVCGSSASLSRNFLAFAGVPQVSRKTFWCLQHCCKHFQKRFGHHVASVDALCRLYSYVELTFSKCVFDVVPPSKSITADTDPCCYPECVLGSPSCVRWRSATSSWQGWRAGPLPPSCDCGAWRCG